MANTPIDTEVLTQSLKEIARALENLEESIRAGARLRASNIQIMTNAINAMVQDIEKSD